ncbi:S41 family peptidase [Zunongwangia sp. F363]|uniref:S41 family peptidase n=1 Tax=Autumnicola tepida TaxID=3075595 RepID=A0ABU3CCX8_9FLAO|nr:S41 family peptidase [Zunongwangia sp. F363]MDT0644194.1 S41 family peptidase [Zunongwangia sp. F363]
MKFPKFLITLSLFGILFTSCEKDNEFPQDNRAETSEETSENPETNSLEAEDIEVEEFIYSGMNDIYLYKADIPQLADDYFSSDTEEAGFLRNYGSPEDLFEDLTSSQDRFSFLTDDYISLEESFEGISSSTAGMDFGLGSISGTNNIFAFLRYVVPNTAADEAGLSRGTVFTEINGKKLTINNISDLLDLDSFTINVGRIENGTIIMTDETATLNKNEYTENPVYISKTLEIDLEKIGYLMYNSFIGDFDDELNAAFADFKAEGVTNLVLDLRYNGGGSVESAVDLASMITGQFEGEVFMKEQWNEEYQSYFEAQQAESLINRFDSRIRTQEAINSLNLSKVYVITSASTASASELVINGLEPYIDVVQIGETTTGKFQASVTLYDSPDYSRENASENHTYAIQPLVFKSANADGKSDYLDGLEPDIKLSEDLNNFGNLGEASEPLLEAAINNILGRAQVMKKGEASMKAGKNFITVGESGMNKPNYQRMYIDQLPALIDRESK